MKVIHLDSVYQSTNEKTQATWLENEGIGSIRETPDYDPTKLALATGIRPTMPAQIQQLFNKLNDLVRDDVLADRLPEACFHFTFLPLTLPLYAENEVLPEKISQLGEMWADYQARRITVRELRLVALPGQLLLAGIPDEAAVAMRHAFCQKVLVSPWKQELLARHAATPLPAPFWHSTLLRYQARFLPAQLRRYFQQNQARRFGTVSGELKLVKVNYNWARCDFVHLQNPDIGYRHP
ncbi:hypothetical protein Q8726_25480 [Raoultella ornithinolytica]|uniref:hypothetical protein n=1 Tax=Raoultella ornithinolytica TaxID=54291 RepID=UPI002739E486|nr:hypothetical protein [Raoultella ornithinolytica]WLP21665.1 hypothetical protein Q8726_25480 [Raoultella ornithinolytica]